MSSRKTKLASRSPSSSTESISNAIVKPTHHKTTTPNNFTSMVKKFMEKRSTSNTITNKLIIPADFIAHDLKKSARKTSKFPNKLFSNGEKKAALTEVKINTNTRTLAMVLKSERELLTINKDQELLISQLQSLLQQRNLEVEKLKDLCLKQKEEIKGLKSAVLFPEEMNMQLHNMLDKHGSASQLIPNLQTQISCLTDQLQILSQDIAQVKAVKYNGTPCNEGNYSFPRTPIKDHQEPANSLDFSDDDPTTPDSPDDMLLKDVNPCLTPCYSKIKSKEYGAMVRDYSQDSRKISRSWDHLNNSTTGSSTTCDKCIYLHLFG